MSLEQVPSDGAAAADALAARILADLDTAPAPLRPALWQAIELGTVEEVRRLIAAGADLNGYPDGGTPLVHAIDLESDTAWQRYHEPDHESTELTELLLVAGAVPTAEAFAVAHRYGNRRALAFLGGGRSGSRSLDWAELGLVECRRRNRFGFLKVNERCQWPPLLLKWMQKPLERSRRRRRKTDASCKYS